jgi:hypothetical protein
MKMTLLCILFLIASVAGAQTMIQPQPADPDHQTTQVTTAVAEALLMADVQRALETIGTLATPAYRDGKMEADVRGYIERIGSPDAYAIEMVMIVPDTGMLVGLRNNGEPEEMLPVLVEMDSTPPHLVSGMRLVQLRMQQAEP